PGLALESISRLQAINARILQELGHLDGDGLRTSCLVAQKELGRLASLSLADRERAVQQLLGLERWAELAGQFTFTHEQEQQLQRAERYRDLARAQAEAPAAAAEEETLAARLDAVRL